MGYWTKERIDRHVKRNAEAIKYYQAEINRLKQKLKHHEDRLIYIHSVTDGQTKIDFDENDTNQY